MNQLERLESKVDNLQETINQLLDTLAKKKQPTIKASSSNYPPEFELLWAKYPKRNGGNPKQNAFRAWKARLKEGEQPARIETGVLKYCSWCAEQNVINTGYVMQAARFFGPNKEYLTDWSPPEPKPQSIPSLNRPEELVSFGQSVGIEARPGENYYDLRARISAVV